jgi:hypothetical protein
MIEDNEATNFHLLTLFVKNFVVILFNKINVVRSFKQKIMLLQG